MRRAFILIAVTVLITVLIACDDGTSPPITGAISGTITFTGDWPVDSKGTAAEAVYVCLGKDWPFTSSPKRSPEVLEPGADGLIDYTVTSIPLGTYAAVALFTYPTFEYMGAYGCVNEGDTPTPIELTEANPVLTGIDFPASSTGGSQTGSISGTVTFTGTWPSGNVYAMAFKTYPPSGPPVMSIPITEASEFDYIIESVAYGTYGVVGLFDENQIMYGAYGYNPPGDTTPEPVTVDANTPNPIDIDFNASNP